MKGKIALITHFNYSDKGPIHGPVDSIIDYLKNKKMAYTLIAHPLYSGCKSFEEEFDGYVVKRQEFGFGFKLHIFPKSLIEVVESILLGIKGKYKVIIAIDPLNFLSAIVLRILGRCEKVVFYTVDYADRRFVNKFTNYVYHFIDHLAVKNSDYVWSVSRRILKRREREGFKSGKNLYVPNSPIFSSVKRLSSEKVDRFKVIMVIGRTHSYTFDRVLSAFKTIVGKYPKARLVIIGPEPRNKYLNQKIISLDLSNNVETLGQLDHKLLINNLISAGLGLAIYTKDYAWTFYGDSMKVREYLLCGLPVIITNAVSTAVDIFQGGAGIVIKPDSKEIMTAIDRFFKDKKFWLNSRKNAIALAKEFDLDKILNSAFDKVFDR